MVVIEMPTCEMILNASWFLDCASPFLWYLLSTRSAIFRDIALTSLVMNGVVVCLF